MGTEGCHHHQEDYGQANHQQHHRGNNGGAGYTQYSSQDSLPDSPYSSQSLDSQPATGQDRIGRSMPNLNKIRGQNKGTVGLPQGSQMSQGRGSTIAYGLSRQHTSD